MDARLRQLERLLRSGDPALLRERLRAGMLSPDDLWLAAHLGHTGARELLGEEAPAVREELSEWVNDLARRGLAVEVAIGAVSAALPVFGAVRPEDDRPAKVVAATRALRESRGDHRHLGHVLSGLVLARDAADEVGSGAAHWAAMSAHLLGCSALEESAGSEERYAWAAIDAAVRALGQEEVRAAIALALLPEGLKDLAA